MRKARKRRQEQLAVEHRLHAFGDAAAKMAHAVSDAAAKVAHAVAHAVPEKISRPQPQPPLLRETCEDGLNFEAARARASDTSETNLRYACSSVGSQADTSWVRIRPRRSPTRAQSYASHCRTRD